MAEYIEREAVLNEQVEICHWDGLNDSYGDFVPVETVRSIPAADVVEVCRCGQCRHATDDIIVEGVCYCHKIQQGMFLDGFCSYGEGRTDK